MNDLDRRALLASATVVGLAALSSRASAGPVNPPAGPVAPTGRTLDEVYNKIPAGLPNGTGDGRIPITGPTTISAPGSYVLVNDISAGAAPALTITASNVCIDLNGYRIAQTASTNLCISITADVSNLTIRNGAIIGGASAILCTAAVNGALFEDLRIQAPRYSGIALSSTSNRGIVVRRCHFVDVGLTTTNADASLLVIALNLGGDAHHADQCTVSRMYNFATTPSIRGINISGNGANSGCLVSRCFVTHEVGLTGTGIQLSTGSAYRDNTVMLFSVPYSVNLSTDGGGNV